MSERIPFALVEIEVLKLYERGYELTDVNDIVNHFDFITTFIGACGWNVDDYTEELMQWNKQKNLN
jgi:hypothetical protein